MSLRSKRIVGLALGGLVTVSAAVAPAAAQGLSVIAPTRPTWARWLDLQTGSEFVLGATRRQIQIANFQEPRRVRLCVTSGASHVAARAVTEDGEIVVPVGHCRDIQAARITVMPAAALGGNRRVKGLYDIVG